MSASPRFDSGGDEGDRTLDLSVANATLSQLSYIPMIWMPVGVQPDMRNRCCLSLK